MIMISAVVGSGLAVVCIILLTAFCTRKRNKLKDENKQVARQGNVYYTNNRIYPELLASMTYYKKKLYNSNTVTYINFQITAFGL